jgi:hypothetical protein
VLAPDTPKACCLKSVDLGEDVSPHLKLAIFYFTCVCFVRSKECTDGQEHCMEPSLRVVRNI